MATTTTNKYAGLPDIDLDQQDIYETPDIQDDVSTVPTSLSDDEDDAIERQGISIETARQRFADENVDAEYADFSDSLVARLKKRSYQTSRIESTEREETLEEKMARVRREVEEIQMEMVNEKKPEKEIDEWTSLIPVLSNNNSATNIITERVQKITSPAPSSSNAEKSKSFTLTYSPSETTQLSTLSKRLSALESLLGLPLTSSTSPILPSLSHLSSKLNLLSSQSHFDSLTQRIKSLTTDLDRLEEKREQARQRALLDPEDSPPPMEESDTARKIDALYASLATIDRLAPVVPGILDRLRGMSVVHADAAGVTVGLKDLEGRLAGMEKEAQEWTEALGKVESNLKEVAGRVGGAVEVTEGVVKGLEVRVKSLEK